jgi:hypothetical protein
MRASGAAVIHPALPPPTTTILLKAALVTMRLSFG